MGLIFRRAVFDRDVLAHDEACFLQALAKRGDEVRGVNERGVPQETNNGQCRLLCPRRERQRDRRALSPRAAVLSGLLSGRAWRGLRTSLHLLVTRAEHDAAIVLE